MPWHACKASYHMSIVLAPCTLEPWVYPEANTRPPAKEVKIISVFDLLPDPLRPIFPCINFTCTDFTNPNSYRRSWSIGLRELLQCTFIHLCAYACDAWSRILVSIRRNCLCIYKTSVANCTWWNSLSSMFLPYMAICSLSAARYVKRACTIN